MKDCGGDYGANIELYLDKELSGPELEEFRAHLEVCAACRRSLRRARSFSVSCIGRGPCTTLRMLCAIE
jgi:anti-sigma factor RsiW